MTPSPGRCLLGLPQEEAGGQETFPWQLWVQITSAVGDPIRVTRTFLFSGSPFCIALIPRNIQICKMGTIVDDSSYSRRPAIICAHKDIRICLSMCTTLSDGMTKFTPWNVSEQANPLRNDSTSRRDLISVFLPTFASQTLWCSFHNRPPSYDSVPCRLPHRLLSWGRRVQNAVSFSQWLSPTCF